MRDSNAEFQFLDFAKPSNKPDPLLEPFEDVESNSRADCPCRLCRRTRLHERGDAMEYDGSVLFVGYALVGLVLAGIGFGFVLLSWYA